MTQSREERLAKMREYSRHRREWLKDHGLCAQCGQATPRPGKVLCWDCANFEADRKFEKRAKMTEEQKQTRRERDRMSDKTRREKRAALHLCLRCGKQLAESYGFKYCLECRIKRNRCTKAYSQRKGAITWEQRVSGYYCVICCKPIEPGPSHLCPECYQKNAERAARMREKKARKKALGDSSNNSFLFIK